MLASQMLSKATILAAFCAASYRPSRGQGAERTAFPSATGQKFSPAEISAPAIPQS